MPSMVPVNDLARYAAQVRHAATERAGEVLASGHYVLGPWVRRFEEAFGEYCGRQHCIGVGNGTDALELALRAVGVEAGSGVALVANGAMYATGAALIVGAEPVFVDVDGVHGVIDAAALEAGLRATKHTVRAVVVTHLYGRLADMPPIVELCRARGLALIEDCAQAHGAADSAGRRAGSFGEVATFSFYPTKNLGAAGDGGALVCDDPALAGRIRQLRQYGWSRKYINEVAFGRNSRLDEMQAALLHLFLGDLEPRNERRRRVANRYSSSIRHPLIRVPPALGPENVAHLYVVQCEKRAELSEHLATCGVATDIHYPVPDHHQPVLANRYVNVNLPQTERLCQEVLTLPCFPELEPQEVERVIEACNSWRPA